MKFILPFFLLLNIFICNGHLLPWLQDIPTLEIQAVNEEENVEIIYNTYLNSRIVPHSSKKQYEVSYSAGQNCGSKGQKEAIYVDSIGLPDLIVLGGNATVSAAGKVNREIKTATLLSVVLKKAGFGDIPCMDNIGSCNYTKPCEFLEKIECPKVIIAQGWDCRCPVAKNSYSFPAQTVSIPRVPLPAFLVDGKYDGKVQLFDGDEELLCYKMTVTVKEKE